MPSEKTEKPVEVKKPAKAAVEIEVKVVRRTGAGSLVEYLDGDMPKRVVIPTSKVKDGRADEDVVKAGVPVGLDWAAVVEEAVLSTIYMRALRTAGFWTLEDIRAKPNQVASVLMRVSPRVNLLIRAVESMKEK